MTYPITRHPPTYKENFMKIPKGERVLREILEEIQRVYPDMTFRSQDPGDFCMDGRFVIECDGPLHKRQRRMDNDAWRDSELQKLGYYIFRFEEKWILERTASVKQVILNLHLLTRKEAAQ